MSAAASAPPDVREHLLLHGGGRGETTGPQHVDPHEQRLRRRHKLRRRGARPRPTDAVPVGPAQRQRSTCPCSTPPPPRRGPPPWGARPPRATRPGAKPSTPAPGTGVEGGRRARSLVCPSAVPTVGPPLTMRREPAPASASPPSSPWIVSEFSRLGRVAGSDRDHPRRSRQGPASPSWRSRRTSGSRASATSRRRSWRQLRLHPVRVSASRVRYSSNTRHAGAGRSGGCRGRIARRRGTRSGHARRRSVPGFDPQLPEGVRRLRPRAGAAVRYSGLPPLTGLVIAGGRPTTLYLQSRAVSPTSGAAVEPSSALGRVSPTDRLCTRELDWWLRLLR